MNLTGVTGYVRVEVGKGMRVVFQPAICNDARISIAHELSQTLAETRILRDRNGGFSPFAAGGRRNDLQWISIKISYLSWNCDV